MTQTVVAVVGVSGVGKSTLLDALRSHLSFQHLQASTLIREERQATRSESVTADALRCDDIDENQRLLVLGFRRSINPLARLIVLDGHTIVDTATGLKEIGPKVFGELGVERLIFLAGVPAEIARRREADKSRNRPGRSAEEIGHYQEAALLSAFRTCLELRIRLDVVSPDALDQLKEILLKSSEN